MLSLPKHDPSHEYFQENRVKIKMLESRTGSPDGVTVCSYARGEQYELPDDLARVFVQEGWGKLVQARGRKRGTQKKDLGSALENKMQ
jgi:hypothetical protein